MKISVVYSLPPSRQAAKVSASHGADTSPSNADTEAMPALDFPTIVASSPSNADTETMPALDFPTIVASSRSLSSPGKVFDALLLPQLEAIHQGMSIEEGRYQLQKVGINLTASCIRRILSNSGDRSLSWTRSRTGSLERKLISWLASKNNSD